MSATKKKDQGADEKQADTKKTAAYTMLHHLSSTEYLQYGGGKFSKRDKRGVFGDDAAETGIPVEVWRYFLLANR